MSLALESNSITLPESAKMSLDKYPISTYAFLSEDEMQIFASQHQQYLIKEVYEYRFPNVTGTKKVTLDSLSMVANWMWYFQRSDAYMRNEWSNYSNWPYDYLPSDLKHPSEGNGFAVLENSCGKVTPSVDPIGTGCFSGQEYAPTNIYVTGRYSISNQKDIMQTWSLLLDGTYRENDFDAGVFNYVEKYARSTGNSPDGLYCYNFNLTTDPFDFQPSGAINLSKFKNIELDITTYVPPIDPINSRFDVICDGEGNAIGFRKENWRLYDYNYNMTLYEERYNVLSFIGGSCGMLHSR